MCDDLFPLGGTSFYVPLDDESDQTPLQSQNSGEKTTSNTQILEKNLHWTGSPTPKNVPPQGTQDQSNIKTKKTFMGPDID